MKNQIKTTTPAFLTARDRARKLLSDISYRLETVAELNGVEIINDSKATDLASTFYSLELMDKPVVWMVGANELEEDYSVFQKVVKYKVKSIVSFGKAEGGLKLIRELEPYVDHMSWYDSLDIAVFKAWTHCKEGDALLFSPATPSFDMYEDFRTRGDAFNRMIERLEKDA